MVFEAENSGQKGSNNYLDKPDKTVLPTNVTDKNGYTTVGSKTNL